MKYRKLQIVWSIAWGVAAVLLGVLWWRSYWRADTAIWVGAKPRGLRVTVFSGYIEFNGRSSYSGGKRLEWRVAQPAEHAPPLWLKTMFGFGFKPRAIVLPLWLPTILAAMLCTGPWLRWSRSFSLRTLLVAITLVAVLLGLLVSGARN